LELNIDTAPDVAELHEDITRLIIEGVTGGQTAAVGADTEDSLATYPP
jgi:hypothetical protein